MNSTIEQLIGRLHGPLTVQQVSEILGGSVNEVRRFLRDGDLVGDVRDGVWMISKDEVRAFLEARRRFRPVQPMREQLIANDLPPIAVVLRDGAFTFYTI